MQITNHPMKCQQFKMVKIFNNSHEDRLHLVSCISITNKWALVDSISSKTIGDRQVGLII